MNIELLVIKLFLIDTNTYTKYNKYVSTKYNNIYNKIYQTISKLKEDGKPSHTVEELAVKFHILYPIQSNSETESVSGIFDSLKSINVNVGQADELLTQMRNRSIASELAIKAVEVASGDEDIQTLIEAFEGLKNEIPDEAEEEDFVNDDIVAIKERHLSEPPFKFRLRTLNQILGGLRRRTFGFLFARPEVGKTQLLASEGSFLAPQTRNGLLWVNNEEDGTALVTRCYQATLLKDAHELYKNAEKAREAYTNAIQGKIRIYDKPEARARDIEAVIRSYRPDIVFIDQLDKVNGFDAERYDLVQKAKYQWARELSKKYNCAVLGVCQASGEGEGKKYLGLNDVDSSRTGKQGEADFMFGLGTSDRIGEEDMRFISVCKNKLPVTPDMISEMRHAKVRIRSRPEIQIYEDVLSIGSDA